MHNYPKYVYHPSCEPLLIHSKEQHEAIGKDWKETPADFETPQEIPTGTPEGDKDESPKTYREHMAEWESKEEKKPKRTKVVKGDNP